MSEMMKRLFSALKTFLTTSAKPSLTEKPSTAENKPVEALAPTVLRPLVSRKTGRAGLELIQHFEGCKLQAYKDSVGILTIGYGHTSNVKDGQTITMQQAIDFLKEDLEVAERAVHTMVKVPINQNQFDALVAFVFNLGAGRFKSSTLLFKLNAGDYQGAAEEFLRWNKAGGTVLVGLTRRRKAERELFLKMELIS